MNGLLDKWKCPLQCRYNNKYAVWTKVIILTNAEPEALYPVVHHQQRDSFLRRLTKIVKVESQEQEVAFELDSQPASSTPPSVPAASPVQQPQPQTSRFVDWRSIVSDLV